MAPRSGTPIVHPDYMTNVAGVAGFMEETVVTIEEDMNHGQSSGSFGEEAEENWQPLAGHVSLPCRISMRRRGAAQQAEREYDTGTVVLHSHFLLLDGYYPEISEKHRAVSEALVLDIEEVQHASSNAFTQLSCQVVE